MFRQAEKQAPTARRLSADLAFQAPPPAPGPGDLVPFEGSEAERATTARIEAENAAKLAREQARAARIEAGINAAKADEAAPIMVDIGATAAAALPLAEAICRAWLPDGKRQGAEWVARNPTRQDDRPGSFSVNLESGAWSDFATGDRGGDLVSLVRYLDNAPTQGAAARRLAEWLGTAPADPAPRKSKAKAAAKGYPVRPDRHPSLGAPSASWDYRDPRGILVASVYRFDTDEGRRKEYRPVSLGIDGRWYWRDPAKDGLPLYRLNLLATRPEAPAIVCEGEKAADAAAALLPDWITTTTMHGAQSPGRSDFAPLAGREVHIWPDADAPGAKYAADVARLATQAGAASVRLLDLAATFADRPPPPDSGWDAADFLAEWERPAAAPGWLADHARWIDWQPAPMEADPSAPAPDAADPDPAPAAVKPPPGWRLKARGVYEEKEDGDVRICGPLWVIGRTTGPHGEWGTVLSFQDDDGTVITRAIPQERLHEDPGILARELARLGLSIVPSRHKKLLDYLEAWKTPARILSAKRLGWMEDKSGALGFVLPDRVVRANGGIPVMFQPERHSPTIKTVHAAGALSDWQAGIAARVVDHDLMLFALAAGFAPALLAFSEAADSFLIHCWGTTSRGKTTLAQIAASPWGCAADPNDAPSLTFIRRWNLTGNGLEGLAEAHSDIPLVLDELGASTVGDVRPLVYMLSGGQGKTALNSAREMREPRVWRTVAFSTGELSMFAKMSDPDGSGTKARTVKAGLSHRALDVEVTDIAAAAPKADRESLVSGIKTAAARTYGTAGPAFVAFIARRFATAAAARAHLRERIACLVSELTPDGIAVPQETARALRRFAMIAVAGELATEAGLIPTDRARIAAAVRAAVRGWHGHAPQTDEDRIIAAVRGFILRHGARFQRIGDTDGPPRYRFADGDPNEPVRDRAGWYHVAEGLWHFTDEGLIEAAPGNDPKTIARALRKRGVLFTNETDGMKARVNFNVEGKRPRMYTVKGSIIDGETDSGDPSDSSGEAGKTGNHAKTPGQPGQTGQALEPRGFEPVREPESSPGQPGQGTRTDARTDESDGCPSESVRVVREPDSEPGRPESEQPRGFVRVVRAVRANYGDSEFSPDPDEETEVF